MRTLNTKAILVIDMPDGERPEDYKLLGATFVHKEGKYPIYKTAFEIKDGELKHYIPWYKRIFGGKK